VTHRNGRRTRRCGKKQRTYDTRRNLREPHSQLTLTQSGSEKPQRHACPAFTPAGHRNTVVTRLRLRTEPRPLLQVLRDSFPFKLQMAQPPVAPPMPTVSRTPLSTITPSNDQVRVATPQSPLLLTRQQGSYSICCKSFVGLTLPLDTHRSLDFRNGRDCFRLLERSHRPNLDKPIKTVYNWVARAMSRMRCTCVGSP
jgi:hypothetical protein